jgi:transketolase
VAKKETINDKKIIDNIRALSIDMIQNAGSGHPGIALGAAPMLYTLYTRHMNANPNDDKWINRDRFVMSAGHGSALLYATLMIAGFGISLDDLKLFRKIGSKTPGHPEYGVTPGIDITTGPLGQGFAAAVGMAMAERFLGNKYNKKKKAVFEQDKNIFDHYTYVLCSDGDLMEGVSYEAASLAGTLRLNKLIVLYDSNNISLDGKTNLTFTEDVIKRFDALGWHTQFVKDGENVEEIDKAIMKAKRTEKPSLIMIKTVIGRGSLLAGTNDIHGSVLNKDDVIQLKNSWGIRDIPFAVSKEAVDGFRSIFTARINKQYNDWNEKFRLYMEEATDEVKVEINLIHKKEQAIDLNLSKLIWQFDENMREPIRDTNGKIMNVIGNNMFNFIGGSADVASSTKTFLRDYPIYSYENYTGKNIYFGVREHAMGAIMNGLALSGFRVFGSTFLVFSDYMKPTIRLAALMNLPVIYVFSHDSVNIGQDGPTHQPIEQLAMLRSIPNLDVYRPADAREVVGAWNSILKSNNPCAMVVSRNEASLLKHTNMDNVERGAYMVRREVVRLSGTIIATGSEVETALIVAEQLYTRGIDLRVISMPCIERFIKQPVTYQEELLPVGYKTFVIEAGSSSGWHRFVYNDKYLITIDKFGSSGTEEEVLKHCEFDIETIIKKIEKLFR